MGRKKLIGLAGCAWALGAAIGFSGELKTRGAVHPQGLTVEHLTDATGIDAVSPRLGWRLKAVDREMTGLRQTAYQIAVASSREKLEKGQADLWDSGKVESEQSFGVGYSGKALQSSQRCWWRVRVWENKTANPSAWSQPHRWVMGVMKPGDWKAKWIGGNAITRSTAQRGKHAEELVSPAFEKEFTVGKNLQAATLHITGVGYYEASLNGNRIGNKVLDPIPSQYHKRVYYSTYDLTDKISPGKNKIRVLLGHGFYDLRCRDAWNFTNAPWRNFPRMIAQLELVYSDGEKKFVVSDDSWRQIASPIGYDCVREGEIVGRLHPDAPNLQKQKVMAEIVPSPTERLTAQAMPGSVVRATLPPVSVQEPKPGIWLVDFGQNLSGWFRLKVRGQKAGDRIVIELGERVFRDGTIDRNNISALVKHPGPATFINLKL